MAMEKPDVMANPFIDFIGATGVGGEDRAGEKQQRQRDHRSSFVFIVMLLL